MQDSINTGAENTGTPPADNSLGHAGELEMRSILPSRIQWSETSLTRMMQTEIPPRFAAFIEAQPFFFIATASADGHCDASFRGREYSSDGEPLPAVKVISPTQLVFPDFSGNGLYNSLGNIRSNPHIGMIFMDFQRQARVRLNGTVEIKVLQHEENALWPMAQALVVVTVEQVFGNCTARIPRMQMVEGSDAAF